MSVYLVNKQTPDDNLITEESFSFVLQSLYCDDTALDKQLLPSLLATASMLQFSFLIDKIVQHISDSWKWEYEEDEAEEEEEEKIVDSDDCGSKGKHHFLRKFTYSGYYFDLDILLTLADTYGIPTLKNTCLIKYLFSSIAH